MRKGIMKIREGDYVVDGMPLRVYANYDFHVACENINTGVSLWIDKVYFRENCKRLSQKKESRGKVKSRTMIYV